MIELIIIGAVVGIVIALLGKKKNVKEGAAAGAIGGFMISILLIKAAVTIIIVGMLINSCS